MVELPPFHGMILMGVSTGNPWIHQPNGALELGLAQKIHRKILGMSMIHRGFIFGKNNRSKLWIFHDFPAGHVWLPEGISLQLGYLTWVLHLFLDGSCMLLPTYNAQDGPPSSNCIIAIVSIISANSILTAKGQYIWQHRACSWLW